ncbi:hypothetical protein B0H12DRAFT_1114171 [Mycena haematopus]|nr:hypothetical protein B0H12DRAFT_1114171 [Mycena haematopus]
MFCGFLFTVIRSPHSRCLGLNFLAPRSRGVCLWLRLLVIRLNSAGFTKVCKALTELPNATSVSHLNSFRQ